MIRLGNNEVVKLLTKTLTFVDAMPTLPPTLGGGGGGGGGGGLEQKLSVNVVQAS